MAWEDTYRDLSTYLIETSVLGSAAALLGWDELTYMPTKAADGRAKQLSLLARMSHERFVSPKVGAQLEELAGQALDADATANVREWRRLYRRAVTLPPALVEEMTRTGVHARMAWGAAKAASDYAKFKPWLAKTIDLQRQKAACLCGHQPANADEQYDALLDGYEPYQTSVRLRQLFGELRPGLVELVGRVKQSTRRRSDEVLWRNYPIEQQRRIGEAAAKAIGFDFSAGRLDTTLHPFCSGITPGDVRITTRYTENGFGNCFFSIIHETGHALYEQGLPAEHWGTPLGDAVSLGVHESQSRLWENFIGRSEAFWRFFYPTVQQAFPGSLGDVAMDDFVSAINTISPSLIRTEADEATYNLHIMLRFELEQQLLWGELGVDDLPAAWNGRMQQYLGLNVPSDREGCLQDVHWSGGMFGYFPTYTLGNLNAAALFEAARAKLGDLESLFAAGTFGPLLEWLRQNIHRHGMRYPAAELMQKATGHELSVEPLLAHLRAKVSRYYR